MAKKESYIKSSYDELMTKVSWPTWSELQSSSIVVAIASAIIALIIYLMDQTFSNIMDVFYSLFA
jgi:preprotein translocase subunit SecE